jgi:hypothetical protein
MKSTYQFTETAGRKPESQLGRHAVFMAVLLSAFLGLARNASAQVVFSGDKGGITLAAGATASGYEVQYGQQKLLGVAGVVDVDTRRRFGLEAEGRWLMFHETNQLHATTWMAGPRYHFTSGKFQFYGKGLVGMGQFYFPYNYAQGNYLVIAPGGGVDYRWKRRISFRLADVEYQIWPQFTFGSMTSYGVSAGVRYHIF